MRGGKVYILVLGQYFKLRSVAHKWVGGVTNLKIHVGAVISNIGSILPNSLSCMVRRTALELLSTLKKRCELINKVEVSNEKYYLSLVELNGKTISAPSVFTKSGYIRRQLIVTDLVLALNVPLWCWGIWRKLVWKTLLRLFKAWYLQSYRKVVKI